MDITLPAFTPIEESLFLTLCGRALEAEVRYLHKGPRQEST